MSAYAALAGRYDALTGDVPYKDLADWYEAAFALAGGAVHTVLDMGCGTGTLSLLLAERGYEMICTDASADMLSVFQQKLWEAPEGIIRPLLLCQRSEELDLYGTVEACICSLDGMNYLAPELLPEVFRRLRLFIAPGGVLAFDFLDGEHLRSLDGQCFVDEREDLLCLWRAGVEAERLRYGMDIFQRRRDGSWQRSQEEHTEYIHEAKRLEELLLAAGFGDIRFYDDGPQNRMGRRFLTAKRL